jgi:hypothetical protein
MQGFETTFVTGKNPFKYSRFAKNIFLPERMPQFPLKKQKLNDLEIYVPTTDDRCFDSPLPCTPYLNSDLEMRGKNLEDGFRIKKREN